MSSKVRVGVAGWSYPDWEGIVYPRSEPDKLRYMAQYFDLIEINTSFYRIPSVATAVDWTARVSEIEKLTFAVKLHQSFTHQSEYPAREQSVLFSEFVEPLRQSERLDAILVQFPFSFRDGVACRERLERIRGDFPDDQLAVEVRSNTFGDDFFEYLIDDLDICPVAIDQPGLEGFIGPTARATGNLFYARFHGRNARKWFDHEESWERYDYRYDRVELAEWSARLESTDATKVLVVMNNHFRGQAVLNGLQLRADLGQRATVPQSVAEYYGREQFGGLEIDSSPQQSLPFFR